MAENIMREHIKNKVYHIEIVPTKHNVEDIEAGLNLFAEKYTRALNSGYCICLTDNAMGLMAFQGHELIPELELPVDPDHVMIHLNTYHTKEGLDELLDINQGLGLKYYLIVTGDGNDRLHRLEPDEIGAEDAKIVTSVELMKYVHEKHPEIIYGCAFNPYEPPEEEFAKLDRKLAAGASFIITQPIIEKNAIVDELLEKYPDVPVIIEAWMSKKLYLLSDVVGHEIPEDTFFDPLATLKELTQLYPGCGFYLSLRGFKTQYHLIGDLWT